MIATLPVLMLLTGCVTGVTSCPKPVTISKEIQAQAAVELGSLSKDSALGIVLAANLDDRDKLRACRRIN